MSDQYLRKCTLVASTGSQGLDLSSLRIRFKLSAAHMTPPTPNTADIWVFNPNDETAQALQQEYQRITLSAGYEQGNFGVIFDGTVAQIVRGRTSPVDTYVRFLASDGDQAFNFAVISKSMAAGASPQDQAKAVLDGTSLYGVTAGDLSGLQNNNYGGVLPRGKVLFGLARAQLNNLTQTTGAVWSIQNGKVQVLPLTGYAPGEAVVLTSDTGLIGIPEATVDGLNARCLLNPNLMAGKRVKIDNASINRTTINRQGLYPEFGDVTYVASVTRDGIYAVMVVEHEGDTRGQEWYSNLTCLAIDPSSPADQSVQAF